MKQARGLAQASGFGPLVSAARAPILARLVASGRGSVPPLPLAAPYHLSCCGTYGILHFDTGKVRPIGRKADIRQKKKLIDEEEEEEEDGNEKKEEHKGTQRNT